MLDQRELFICGGCFYDLFICSIISNVVRRLIFGNVIIYCRIVFLISDFHISSRRLRSECRQSNLRKRSVRAMLLPVRLLWQRKRFLRCWLSVNVRRMLEQRHLVFQQWSCRVYEQPGRTVLCNFVFNTLPRSVVVDGCHVIIVQPCFHLPCRLLWCDWWWADLRKCSFRSVLFSIRLLRHWRGFLRCWVPVDVWGMLEQRQLFVVQQHGHVEQ